MELNLKEKGGNTPYTIAELIKPKEYKNNVLQAIKEFIKTLILIVVILIGVSGFGQNKMAEFSFIADNLEWKGVAVQDSNYSLWGCAPIQADDGKTHLFIARWPEKNINPAWRKSSEIAHYVADNPEGSFEFSDVVIQGTGENTWDKYAPHNPEIKKVGNKYVLLYIANTNYNQPPHPANQSIGMVISKSPYGPWEKAGNNGLILSADSNPDKWCYNSSNGVVNPAFVAVNGKFYLYFKASGKNGMTRYGLAISDKLEGPYEISNNPITENNATLEDATVFYYKDTFYLLTTDNHGNNTGIVGGGTLWKSSDGLNYKLEDAEIGYNRLPTYLDYDNENVTKIYGADPKLERPKILMIDNKPAYLYAPSGWNIYGGERTVGHVLKINLNK